MDLHRGGDGNASYVAVAPLSRRQIKALTQPLFYLRPLGRDNRVASRIAGDGIRSHSVSPQDSLEFTTDSLYGRA
jgi:hypothetical protein